MTKPEMDPLEDWAKIQGKESGVLDRSLALVSFLPTPRAQEEKEPGPGDLVGRFPVSVKDTRFANPRRHERSIARGWLQAREWIGFRVR